MNESRKFSIGQELAGRRVDQAIAQLLPKLGGRGAKRLARNGLASLNGKKAKSLDRLKAGDLLEVASISPGHAAGAHILARDGPFRFICKPAGMHSTRQAGAADDALEDLPGAGLLLQRLDYGTSGIVLAAASREGAKAFLAAQNLGLCQKRYLALLCGRLCEKIVIKNALDTARRKKTRVLEAQAPEARHTLLTPLKFWPPGSLPLANGPGAQNGVTLAGCAIRLGARHQIRAHAAWAGYPLLGDGLYNPLGGEGFFLHQAALAFNGHACLCLPEWLPEDAACAAREWLEEILPPAHSPQKTSSGARSIRPASASLA